MIYLREKVQDGRRSIVALVAHAKDMAEAERCAVYAVKSLMADVVIVAHRGVTHAEVKRILPQIVQGPLTFEEWLGDRFVHIWRAKEMRS